MELPELQKRVADEKRRTFHGYVYLLAEEEDLVRKNFKEVSYKDCDLSKTWYPIFLGKKVQIGGTYGPMSMCALGYRHICFETMQMRGDTEQEYYCKH